VATALHEAAAKRRAVTGTRGRGTRRNAGVGWRAVVA
jgi:hypothetical protein